MVKLWPIREDSIKWIQLTSPSIEGVSNGWVSIGTIAIDWRIWWFCSPAGLKFLLHPEKLFALSWPWQLSRLSDLVNLVDLDDQRLLSHESQSPSSMIQVEKAFRINDYPIFEWHMAGCGNKQMQWPQHLLYQQLDRPVNALNGFCLKSIPEQF